MEVSSDVLKCGWVEVAKTLAAGIPGGEGGLSQMPYQAPAPAEDVAALKTQFDALLTKLVDAGLMAGS